MKTQNTVTLKAFADLSKAQKAFCVRILDVYPEYASEANLTWKQLLAGYFMLKEQRSTTNEKLGFPMWLQKTQIVGRGTYQMPWPSAEELAVYHAQKSTPVVKVAKVKQPKAKVSARLQKIVDQSPVHDADVEDFNAILKENGITV
jgi:hypothetical protein